MLPNVCRASRLLAFALSAFLICPPQVFAQTASTATASQPANLNLSQTQPTMAAGNIQPSMIRVGDHTRQVLPGDMLTPAEYTALQQVMTTGQQTLVVGSTGAATGGLANLSTATLAGLTVPNGVTVLHDFAQTNGIVNLLGDLTNYGNVFAISSSANIASATIKADTIANMHNAVITSVIPVGTHGNVVPNLSLDLQATTSIVNHGTISSAGNLTLTTPELTNSGLILASAGDIHVQSLRDVLTVHNAGGLIQAGGNLLFSSANYNENVRVTVDGGILAGNGVKLLGRGGYAGVDVDEIRGPLSITAAVAGAGVQGGFLQIASLDLTGDPVIYNAGGDVDISGVFSGGVINTAGDDFVVLAAGNIIAPTAGAGSLITTAGPPLASARGRITLAAGVTFTTSGGASPIACADCSGNYSITGTSASGGNITLPTVSLTSNRAVTLQANAGATSSGTISIGNITTTGRNGASGSGSAGETGGAVSITGANSISIGNINTTGGNGGSGGSGNGGLGGVGGAVTVQTSAGTINVGSITTNGGSGGNSGSGTGGAGNTAGQIQLLHSGTGNITVGAAILAMGGNGGTGDAGGLGGAGGAVTVTPTFGDVILTGTVTASGGTGGSGSSGVGRAGGAGGTITLGPATGGAGTLTANLGITSNGGAGGTSASTTAGAGGAGGSLVLSNELTSSSFLSTITLNGGTGGNGDAGGIGGQGGSISLLNGDTDVTVSGTIQLNGGNGGSGSSGLGRAGGAGGDLQIALNSGTLSLAAVQANGGNGGTSSTTTAGAGGFGGTVDIATNDIISVSGVISAVGGNGGNGDTGANGRAGGTITVYTTSGNITLAGLTNSGGNGGTGSSGAGGNGGSAGAIILGTDAGDTTVNGDVLMQGGDGGGSATVTAGNGGAGGGITLIAGSGTIHITGNLRADGGDAGNGDSGGTGGLGGDVSLSGLGNLTVDQAMNVDGGNGGSGASDDGGDGGDAGSMILVLSGSSWAAGSLSAVGGAGGTSATDQAGAGGDGGFIQTYPTNGNIIIGTSVNASGGIGGDGDIGGAGGAGGLIYLHPDSGDVIIGGSVIAVGGDGGHGASGLGGAGGAGGGTLDLIELGSHNGDLIVGGDIISDGGNGGGSSTTTAGAGGSAGPILLHAEFGIINVGGMISASGGDGGNGDAGGSAGNGAAISLYSTTLPTITGFTATNGILATGGNGGSGSSGAGGNGGAGGAITLEPDNAPITSGTLSTSGGNGGNSSTTTAGNGGAAGDIALFTGDSTLTITGSILAVGGTGGTGDIGGTGASGGNLDIQTDNADISITGTVSSSGGAGGGGTSGNGGSALNGAGSIILGTNSAGNITVGGSVLAAGGAGGFSSTNNAGNGSAGNSISLTTISGNISIGGSVSTAGGAGGTGDDGGNGGTGANMVVTTSKGALTVGGNLDAAGGAGGSSTTSAAGGTGSNAGSITASSTGNMLINGFVRASGGAGGTGSPNGPSGTGNNIGLTGYFIGVNGTTGGRSIVSGNGGAIDVLELAPAGVAASVYDQNMNLSTGTNTVNAAVTGALFTVGTGASTISGSLGSINASGGITINGISAGTNVNSGNFGSATGSVTITENGAPKLITTGDLITPAEWISVIQVINDGSQALVLNATGNASGGSFTITSTNVPVGNFTVLSLPSTVSATSSTNLTYSGAATVDGTLNFTGNQTLTAGSLTNNGTISGDANLTIRTNTLVNNSTITTNGAGAALTVGNAASGAGNNMTISGTGVLSSTGTGAPTVSLSILGANQVQLNGSQTFTVPAAGRVFWDAQASGASILLGAGSTQTISNGARLTVRTPSLTFMNNSTIQATGASLIDFTQGAAGNNLSIFAPDSGTGFINTNAAVSFAPSSGSVINFNKTAGAGTGTLNINASSVTATTTSAAMNVMSNVLINSAADVAFTAGGALNLNGSVIAPNINFSTTSNGSIAIGADQTASGTMTISANGNGSISRTAGTLIAPTLSLSSGTGSIGSAINNIVTDVDNLTANSGGTSNVYISENDSVVVGASTAGNLFSLTVGANLSTGDASGITAQSITLATTAASSGSITINSDVNAVDTISLIAGGSGNIVWNNGAIANLTATNVNLTTGTGDIGSAGTPIRTRGENVSISSTGGSAWVREQDGVVLAASVAGQLIFSAGNNITTSGAVSADVLDLSTRAGSNGSITLANNVTVGTSATINADGGGNINRTGGTITGPTLALTSGSGNIGSTTAATRIQTDVDSLAASTGGTGNVHITEANAVTLGASSAGDMFDLSVGSNFDLSSAGSIAAPQIRIATTNDGNITVDAGMSADVSITLAAGGMGSIVNGGPFYLTAPTVNLSSGLASVGAIGGEIYTKTSNVTVNTGGNGDAYVNEFDDVNLGASSVGGRLLLNADGTVTTTGAVSTGTSATINTTGDISTTGSMTAGTFVTLNGNNIDVNGTITGTSAVNLAASGAGTINSNGVNRIIGNTVTLTSGSGNIGMGSNGAMLVTATTLSASTTGDVNISELDNVALAGLTGNNITLSAGNNVTQGSGTVTANTFTVSSTSGDIGTAATNIQTNVGTLNATANGAGGDVFITEANTLVVGPSSANDRFELTVNSAFSTSDAASISANRLLIATSPGGDITINSNLSAPTSITLIAGGASNIVRTAGTLTTGALTLTSGTGNIGTLANPIFTDATSIAATTSAPGSIYINEANAVNLNACAAGGTLQITAGGTITQTNALSAATVNLSVTSGNIQRTAGVITATTANLTAAGGNIGGSGAANNIRTNVTILSANTSGTGNVYITETDSVNLNSSSAGNLFQLSVGGNFSTVGASNILANSITLTTTNNGTININSDFSAAGTITLNAGGSGNITRTAGTLTANVVSLSSGTGSIGAAGAEILTNANSLSAVASGSPTSDVFISELDNVTINAVSTASDEFNLQAGGSIAVNANVTGTNSVVLNAVGDITTGGAAAIFGTIGTFTSSAGNIGGATALRTGVGSLSASAADNVSISTLDAITVTSLSGNDIALTANGSIVLSGNVTSNTNVALAATGAGNITRTAGTVSGTNISLTSGTGNIGTSVAPIAIDGTTLSVNTAGATSDAFITEQNSVQLIASSAGRDLSLTAVNDIDFNGVISVGRNATINSTNGNIRQVGANRFSAQSLSMQTNGGQIGTTAAPILTNVISVTATTTAASGSISINELNDVRLDAMTSGGDITVISGGVVDLNAALAAGAANTVTINGVNGITNSAGTGSISANAAILTTTGDIGSAALPVNTAVNNLTVSATGAASDVFINETNAVNLNNSTSTNGFTLTAGGDIATNAGQRVTAGTLTVQSTGGSVGSAANNFRTNVGSLSASASTAGTNAYIDELNAISINNSNAAATFEVTAGSGIDLNGNINGTTVNLRTTGASDITHTLGTITATNVSLQSSGGSIGSSANRIQTAAANLAANTSGSGDVYITEADAVTVLASSAGDEFDLTVGTNFSSSGGGNISAPRIRIATTNGNITIDSDFGAATSLAFSAGGAGSIIHTSGTLTSPTISLTAAGNIGASGAAVLTDATDLTLNSTTGDAWVTEANAVNLGASSVANELHLQSGNGITVTNVVTSDDLFLTSGSNGSIQFNANATGTTSATIIANGSGSLGTGAGARVTAGALSLSSTSGAIGGASDFNINATTLTANTSGDIRLNELNSVALNGISTTGQVTLTAGGAITQGAGTVTADTFTVTSTGGSIGTAVTPIATNINTLVASANSTGASVFISEANSLAVGNGSANDRFELTVNGNVSTTVATNVTANQILLATTNNGNIQINGSLTAPTSVTLNANGAGTITRNSGTLTSALVTLTSGSGDIGTLANPVTTNAGTIAASTTGNVFLSEVDAVNLNASSAGGTFSLLSGGNLNIQGNVNATTISLAASGANNITRSGGTLIATNVNLSSGTGNIGTSTNPILTNAANLSATTSAPGDIFIDELDDVVLNSVSGDDFTLTAGGTITSVGTIGASDLFLTSTGGDIGSAGTPLSTNSNTIAMNAPAGSVFVNEANAVTIGASSALDQFIVNAGGAITTVGAISGTITALNTTAGNSGISLGANVTGTTSVTLVTSGTGAITQPAGRIIGGALQFTSGGATSLNTDVAGITGSAVGNAVINELDAVTLNSITAANLTVTAGGALTTTVALSTGTLDLTSTAGGIALGANISGTTVNLTANGTGDITQSAGTISGTTLNVTLGSGSSTLNTDITTLTLASGAGSSLTINEANGLSIGAVTGDGLDVTAGGALSTTGVVSANNVTFQTTAASNGDITLGANLTGTTSINLLPGGTGAILQPAGRIFGGALTANPGSGNLSLRTDVTSVSVNGPGNVTISESNAVIINPSSAAGSFSVTTTAGDITANDITASGGTLTLDANSGFLTVNAGANLTSFGDMSLTSSNDMNVLAGAALTAGMLNSGTPCCSILPANSVLNTGSVLLTSGADLIIGNGATLTSIGGAGSGNAGAVGLRATVDINIGTNANLTAAGGDIWISAGDDVDIGTDTQLNSIAKLYDDGATRWIPAANNTTQAYVGGRIGIFVGSLSTNIPALLNNRVDDRTGLDLPMPYPAGFDPLANGINITNGGYFQVIGNLKNTVIGNTFTSDGGVIVIDPPDGLGNAVNISGVTFNAIGPQVVNIPAPPPPPPPTPPAPIVTPTGPSVSLTPPPAISVPVLTQKTPTQSTVIPLDAINFAIDTPVLTSASQPQSIEEPYIGNQQQTQFMMTFTCVPVVIENDKYAVLVGDNGTTFAANQNVDKSVFVASASSAKMNGMKLKEGRLLVMAGQEGVIVETDNGSVMVPPQTSAVVQQDPGKLLRVQNLDGGETQIAVTKGGKTEKLSATSGQEVVIADDSLTDEELIPVDGVDREVVCEATLTFAGTVKAKMAKNTFNKKQMAERQSTLMCNLHGFQYPVPQRYKQLKEKMEIEAALPNKPNQSSEISHLRTIAYAPPAVPAKLGITTISNEAGVLKHRDGDVAVFENANTVRVQSGQALIHSLKPLKVKVAGQSVEMKPGCVAFFDAGKSAIKACNLFEEEAHSMRVVGAKSHATLSPGSELIFVPMASKSIDAVRDNVGRRRVRVSEMGTVKVITSEVSMLSVICNNKLLVGTFNSNNSYDQTLAKKVGKMAVALSIVTASHGAYSSVDPNKI